MTPNLDPPTWRCLFPKLLWHCLCLQDGTALVKFEVEPNACFFPLSLPATLRYRPVLPLQSPGFLLQVWLCACFWADCCLYHNMAWNRHPSSATSAQLSLNHHGHDPANRASSKQQVSTKPAPRMIWKNRNLQFRSVPHTWPSNHVHVGVNLHVGSCPPTAFEVVPYQTSWPCANEPIELALDQSTSPDVFAKAAQEAANLQQVCGLLQCRPT